jgi:hypothetical protein
LKVLVPQLPAAHNGYVELYRNHQVAVFQYEADKSSDAVAAKLQPFRGTLTADAEHRFNAVYESGHVLEAGCNAHGRRKFRDAEDTQPVLAAEGGAFLGAIYGEEDKAQQLGLLRFTRVQASLELPIVERLHGLPCQPRRRRTTQRQAHRPEAPRPPTSRSRGARDPVATSDE